MKNVNDYTVQTHALLSNSVDTVSRPSQNINLAVTILDEQHGIQFPVYDNS